jgi:hypothetical protein
MGRARWITCGALLLVGCTTEVGGQTLAPATTTTTIAAPTISAATTTTVAPLPQGAEAYARQLVSAWVAGDRALVQRLAVPAAVGVLDANDAERPAGWTFVICEPAGGLTPCTFAAGTRQLITVVDDAIAAARQPQGVVEVRFEDNLPPGL